MAVWFPNIKGHIGHAIGDDHQSIYLLQRDGTVMFTGMEAMNEDPDDPKSGIQTLPEVLSEPAWLRWYGGNGRMEYGTIPDMAHDSVIFTYIGGLSGGDGALSEGDWFGVGV